MADLFDLIEDPEKLDPDKLTKDQAKQELARLAKEIAKDIAEARKASFLRTLGIDEKQGLKVHYKYIKPNKQIDWPGLSGERSTGF